MIIRKIFFLSLLFMCTLINISLNAEEPMNNKETNMRAVTIGNYFLFLSVITPEAVNAKVNEAIQNGLISSEEKDEKIKKEIEFLELNNGICISVGILNKNWMNYKPNISRITDRITLEDDNGGAYAYKKIIKNIENQHLGENDTIILSFSKEVIKKSTKIFYVIIRGIDINSSNENQIKVEFPKNIIK
ncbi:hypothetical protein HZA55_05710 [Candidatus Poribacteria bacterium]|nr:hypothetical protein [Candidatus Poribacteria bacterium]